MMKFLIISVTQHTPQTRVNDTIMHMTLNTINSVVIQWVLGIKQLDAHKAESFKPESIANLIVALEGTHSTICTQKGLSEYLLAKELSCHSRDKTTNYLDSCMWY